MRAHSFARTGHRGQVLIAKTSAPEGEGLANVILEHRKVVDILGRSSVAAAASRKEHSIHFGQLLLESACRLVKEQRHDTSASGFNELHIRLHDVRSLVGESGVRSYVVWQRLAHNPDHGRLLKVIGSRGGLHDRRLNQLRNHF